MPDPPADVLVPPPAAGRTWTSTRRVRFGDVHPGGRVRLDALATYIQDVAADDTDDAALGGDHTWVVRRAAIEVHTGPRFAEDLELVTWCGALGRRWAERRVSIRGSRGAEVDAALLWVSLDPRSGRPIPLPEAFVAHYGEAAGGRVVSARLQHPAAVPPGASRRPWPLRATDFDLFGHVNNAAAWAMVEQVLDTSPPAAVHRAEIEYRVAVERGATVDLAVAGGGDAAGAVELWATGRPAGAPPDSAPMLFTTARVWSLDPSGVRSG